MTPCGCEATRERGTHLSREMKSRGRSTATAPTAAGSADRTTEPVMIDDSLPTRNHTLVFSRRGLSLMNNVADTTAMALGGCGSTSSQSQGKHGKRHLAVRSHVTTLARRAGCEVRCAGSGCDGDCSLRSLPLSHFQRPWLCALCTSPSRTP